jgi:hypothetical protein
LGLDLLSPATLPLILVVEVLKLLTPGVIETWALIWAHKSPVGIGFHTLHEEVRDPEGIKEVSCSLFLFSVVLPELKELIDLSMPRLEIDRKRAHAFAATLIDEASCVIEDFEHWD